MYINFVLEVFLKASECSRMHCNIYLRALSDRYSHTGVIQGV